MKTFRRRQPFGNGTDVGAVRPTPIDRPASEPRRGCRSRCRFLVMGPKCSFVRRGSGVLFTDGRSAREGLRMPPLRVLELEPVLIDNRQRCRGGPEAISTIRPAVRYRNGAGGNPGGPNVDRPVWSGGIQPLPHHDGDRTIAMERRRKQPTHRHQGQRGSDQTGGDRLHGPASRKVRRRTTSDPRPELDQHADDHPCPRQPRQDQRTVQQPAGRHMGVEPLSEPGHPPDPVEPASREWRSTHPEQHQRHSDDQDTQRGGGQH